MKTETGIKNAFIMKAKTGITNAFIMKAKTGITNAFIIQALNAFVGGVIYILVPLLMLERGISIKAMGLVFAILPLVTQSNRLIFAIVSDYIGRKKFYWLYGIMNVIHLIVYSFSMSPIGFLLGKTSEGIKDASLWSVNRAYFLDHSRESEKSLIKMRGIGSIFNAVGMLLAGFLLIKFSYDKTLYLLVALSFLVFPNVKRLIDKNKKEISILAVLEALSFKSKSKKFKIFFALFFISGFYFGLTSGYIFPLFLKEKGMMATENIGLILGFQALLGGIFAYGLRSWGKGKNKVLIGGIMGSLLLLMLAFSKTSGLPLLVLVLGIFTGISGTGEETIFVEIANHGSLAGDIGILMIGTHVGMSATQALSGFIISSFGFAALFLSASALNLIFVVLAFKNME